MRIRFSTAAAFLVLATSALAQSNPEEQARSLLDDGRTYREKGKLKQALDNFNMIVTGFPDTSSVDDALLEIGRYYVEVEGDSEKGRQTFEQVVQRYPQSDGAPGAYYYLGWVTLSRAADQAELDDALAQFTRVRRLYPRSVWVERALHASGLVHRKAGDFAEAVAFQRRVSMEYPSSDVAAAAQFEVGHCLALQGEPWLAMEELQQVRNRFPESSWAQLALHRITALHRLHASGQPSFVVDASFTVGSGNVLRDVRAILMSPSGTLWIASDKVNGVVPYGPDGKMGASLRAQNLRSLSLAPSGELLVAAKRAVRIGAKDIKSFAVPSGKPGEMQELEDLRAVVRTQGGDLLVSDGKRKRIFRFGGDYSFQGVFPDNREREVTRMLLDGEGDIVVLDRRAKGVYVYNAQGRLLRSLPARGAGYEVKKPVDVAVDPFRNIYLADENGVVLMFSIDGRLMATVGRGVLKKPKAITLDVSGEILVYDEGQRRVVRFK